MSDYWPHIRIVLALVGIFAAGVIVGRVTAPQSGPIAIEATTSGELIGSSGLPIKPPQVVRMYSNLLGLTPQQRASITPLVRHCVAAAMPTKPQSEERLKILREFHVQLKTKLTPEQQKTFEAIAEDLENQWQERHEENASKGK